MRPRRLPLAALVLSLAVWGPWAGPGAAAPAPAVWTLDDLLLAEEARGWTLSPDGRLAAWVRSRVETVEGEEQRVGQLWLGRLGKGDQDASVIALTRGLEQVAQPAFSPDARHLAFLSDRVLPGEEENGDEEDGEDLGSTQLWVIPVDGGEAYPVTRFDRSIRGFGWTGADTLVVIAQESPSAWERERKEREDTALVVDDAAHEPPVRLFAVTLRGEATRLSANRDWIDSLAVSPDGRRAVVTAQQSLSYQFDQRLPPHTFLVDLASGEAARIREDPALLPEDLVWAPDGKGFYFVNQFTRHPVYRMATILELYYYSLEGQRAEKVDLAWERGLGGGYAPLPDGLVALLADGVRFRPARYTRTPQGWRRRDLAGSQAANLDGWVASRDGRTLLYQSSSVTAPSQLYTARLEGAAMVGERRLTDLNPGYRGKPTGRFEVLRWPGALGETVEGILHYPLDWRDGEPRPLILDIHGGPSGTDRDSWDFGWASPFLLWRQRGAFVLQVNYHGSGGYGLDWVESIAGRYYELEIPDLETGVDLLIARGLVDPGRLGVAGWSNGGILAAELITRTSRYRAASVGAADVEWISDWANVDFGAAFDNYYFGGPPWEKVETYIEKSPFFRLTEVATPTIIHTGTEDRNVPPHQSWSLFRALQQIGRTEARLLLYPGEPHGLRKIAHQRRKVEEDLAWFDRHLFATAAPGNEAIKQGSPLAGLLQTAAAERQGRVWGTREDGRLVPEVVPFAGLTVGRFEVTRAQFRAFDPDFEVAPGEENLPVTGLSFEAARAYAAWLAEVTGRPFRLPTEEEAGKLADAAGSDGNTLDRWAGYTPNPDDAAAIARALAAVAGSAPLLLPTGSLAGAGDPAVFDLDGNAAEWAVAADGSGVPVGPSADRSTDERSTARPAPEYVGLRVVVGADPGS